MIYYRKGKLCREEVGLDLSQPAFRTGYGFFETLCWNGRIVCHLDLHLKRARKSLDEFGIIEEAVDYHEAISEVITANKLSDRFGRVNIFFPVEQGRTFPVICAVPFDYITMREWRLYQSKDVFLTSLMQHKSMNRMAYLNAWREATDKGFDDALLTDFDGNVLESSFASLLFRKGSAFFEPQTDYKLPGTAQEIASNHISIEPAVINIADVGEFEHVYALNSLGGMIPVTAIGNVEFEADHELSVDMSEKILEF